MVFTFLAKFLKAWAVSFGFEILIWSPTEYLNRGIYYLLLTENEQVENPNNKKNSGIKCPCLEERYSVKEKPEKNNSYLLH